MLRRYPTVREVTARARALAVAHPSRAVLRRVGSSRGGQPLHVLTVGHGSRSVLVVAGPHANEPVGGLTALRLAEHLLAGREAREERARYPDVAWHILLCLDPDGARRNERWLAGPMTLDHHFRRMYRPNFFEQPEWLHARRGAEVLPETRALLELQDEIRPFLQCSLHGVDVGGSFVQLTRALPGLAEPLARSAADLGIPLERSPFDAFFWPSAGLGVFDMPPPAGPGRCSGGPLASSRSTWYHPHQYGTTTAIVEAPMWAADEIADGTPHPDPVRVLTRVNDRAERDARFLGELMDGVRARFPAEISCLVGTVDEYLRSCLTLGEEWRPESFEGTGRGMASFTRAQVLALTLAAHRIILRTAGMLYQAVEASGPVAHTVRDGLDRFLALRCAQLDARCAPRWIPLEAQVEHQFRVVRAAFELAAAGPGARSAEPAVLRA